MLGTCGHLGDGASRDVREGRMNSSRNNSREVEHSLECTGASSDGMRNGEKEDVERSRSWRILLPRRCA